MAPGGTKGEAYLAGNARLAVSLRKLRRCSANSLLHSARMILSVVLTCTVPPLRVESSLLKNPIPPI